MGEVVLPSPLLAEQGTDFVDLLATGSSVSDRQFPDPEYCEGALAAVFADYGALTLTAAQTLQALARNADPAKARLRTGSDPRYQVDPVLDLCALLWERADAMERQQLEVVALQEAVFPIGEDEGGTRRPVDCSRPHRTLPNWNEGTNYIPNRRCQYHQGAVGGR